MKKPNFFFPLAGAALFLLLFSGLFVSCDMLSGRRTLDLGRKMPFGMVEFFGDTMLMMHPGTQINTQITPAGAACPLSDFSLIFFFEDDNSGFHLYKKEDGAKLRIELDARQLRVNGRLRSVVLDSSEATGNWLRSYRPDSVAHLRLVVIGKNLSTDWYPRIFELAKINPNISFIAESFEEVEGKDEILLSGLWKASYPEVFVGNDTSMQKADLRAVRTLYLNKSDSLLPQGFLDRLKVLPPGGRIWLDGFEGEEIRSILKTGKPSELVLENTELQDPAVLAAWPGLNALFLAGPVSDLRPLAGLEALEMLGLQAADTTLGLETIRDLRFLSIESDSATAFGVLRQNPDLQFLHLETDSLAQLPDLSEFRKLQGILLPRLELADYSAMGGWEIPFVGMPASDSLIQVVQAQYPAGKVYAQGKNFWGACLGSGWLLLLLPMIWIFLWIKTTVHARRN